MLKKNCISSIQLPLRKCCSVFTLLRTFAAPIHFVIAACATAITLDQGYAHARRNRMRCIHYCVLRQHGAGLHIPPRNRNPP